MRILYIQITGTLSNHPSATRGFCALAHDIVAWVDGVALSGGSMTTMRTIRLTEMVKCALRGDATTSIRPIRPSSRKEPSATVFDEMVRMATCDALPSARMQMLCALFEGGARRKQVATPVIEAPSLLAWQLIAIDLNDTFSTQPRLLDSGTERFACLHGSACNHVLAALAALKGHIATPVDLTVFASACQKVYIDALCGGGLCDQLPSPSHVCLRDFILRENLLGGSAIAPSRLRTDDLGELVQTSCELHVPGLILGLARICGMKPQQIIDRGVRARCMSLLGDFKRPAIQCEPSAVQGGHVIEPDVAHVRDPICVMDFASLYPSLIVAHQFGSHLDLPNIVERLMDLRRDTACVSLAKACKLMANSFYGQLASRTSAIYDPELAGSITHAGRDSLRKLVDAATNDNGRVLYGDTDSAMVTFPACKSHQEARFTCEGFLATFNEALPRPMRVSLQSIFVSCIFLSKKKYIARDAAGILVSIGTPNVRSDWPPVLKSAYTQVACGLLDGLGDDSVKTIVDNQTEHIRGCTHIPDFVAYRRVADPNSTSRHAELARTESFRDDGARYNSGDAIEFVLYTLEGRGRGVPSVRWSLPEKVPPESQVAVAAYVRMFMDQLQPLLLAALGSERAKRCLASSTWDCAPHQPRRTAFRDTDICCARTKPNSPAAV